MTFMMDAPCGDCICLIYDNLLRSVAITNQVLNLLNLLLLLFYFFFCFLMLIVMQGTYILCGVPPTPDILVPIYEHVFMSWKGSCIK